MEQRVRNTQPLGGSIGLGNSPCKIMLSLVSSMAGSGIGIADNNACVYGCRGLAYKDSLAVSASKFPKYMTPIRSEICFTLERSWEINKKVSPFSVCCFFNRFAT